MNLHHLTFETVEEANLYFQLQDFQNTSNTLLNYEWESDSYKAKLISCKYNQPIASRIKITIFNEKEKEKMTNVYQSEQEALQYLIDNGYKFNSISKSYVRYDSVGVSRDEIITVEIEAYPIIIEADEVRILYNVSTDKLGIGYIRKLDEVKNNT